jgi:hypothetical protein
MQTKIELIYYATKGDKNDGGQRRMDSVFDGSIHRE